MTFENTLKALRAQLVSHQIAAFIQPVHDEFLSEYPPSCFKRVEWLCGFSGSAGTLVITKTACALFVDGRYTLQAANEVDTSLIHIFNSGDKTPEAWLCETLNQTSVGYDANLFTKSLYTRLQNTLEKHVISLVPVPNLVDSLWNDRPPLPATPLFLHDETTAGESSESKCKKIAAQLFAAQVDALLIAAPDALCWLLNIRARDVECTPLVLARAVLYADGSVDLWVDENRTPTLPAHIKTMNMAASLATLNGKVLWVDEAQTSISLLNQCSLSGITTIHQPDPCALPKAIKNPLQIAAIRAAHIVDGVAITQTLHWLSTHADICSVSEMEIAVKLLAFRAQHPDFLEPSFPTIAGSGPNGAIVHYRATEKTNRHLNANDMLLLDSGGQYSGGTTDITRTIAIGTPTAEQKKHFTLVLKGHIALATAQFPKGTRGSQLDTLARQYLWQEGLDYDHGTGHGVGQFLGVHEGPQGISKRASTTDLQVGMTLSNEPGYYKENAYGIRIENLVTVVQKENGSLGFDTITCAPIDKNLIDFSLLYEAEKHWVGQYHLWVKEKLSPLLPNNVADWLRA